MKLLLSASSSLVRRLLNNHSTATAGSRCVATVAGRLGSCVCSGSCVLCATHEHGSGSRRLRNGDLAVGVDASSKIMTTTRSLSCGVNHPERRHMGTDADVEAEVQAVNERFLGDVQMKKVNPYQYGVFAQRPYAKGSIVISSNLTDVTPNPKATSCSHSIQTNWNEHSLMDLPAIFMNHTCDPNVGVAKELNEGGAYDFVALRDIEEGEELRWDYETTEYVAVGSFEVCKCGSANCRGAIKGYKYNKDVLLEQYGGKNIAAYLMDEKTMQANFA